MGAELVLGLFLLLGLFVAVIAVRMVRGVAATRQERAKRDRLDMPA